MYDIRYLLAVESILPSSPPLPPSLCSWYFGDIPRGEAEKWLLIESNVSGTFLVRTSSSQKNSLSLSIRDGEGIKHYRIRKLDDGGYFIASRITFRTLQVSKEMHLTWEGIVGTRAG